MNWSVALSRTMLARTVREKPTNVTAGQLQKRTTYRLQGAKLLTS